MLFWYNLILLISFIIASPFIILSFSKPKRRKTFWHRIGYSIGKGETAALVSDDYQPIWIHALSVGEVISAEPLIEQLKSHYPQLPFVFSASTLTGFETAQKMFGNKVDYIFFSPYDFLWSVRKITRCINPHFVIIVETDIWPNFLFHLRRQGIPVALVNARLSEASFKKYLWGKVFIQKVLECFKSVGVQGRVDATRFMRLGVRDNRIRVTGNIKFDQKVTECSIAKANMLRNRMGFQRDDIILIAGSTHPGEEEIVIKVYIQLKKKFKQLSLIIAPRDPSRAKFIAQICSQHGIRNGFLSSMTFILEHHHSSVHIVNKIGILRSLYAVSDIAFIGGSLVNQGGHNPLEPASFAKPVLFGPDMSDFAEISMALIKCGAALRVKNAAGLYNAVEKLICNSDLKAKMGKCALRFLNENRGAVENTMDILRPWINNHQLM